MHRSSIALIKHLLGGLFIGALALVLVSPGEASAQASPQNCGHWNVVSSPNTGTMDTLYGIAAISPHDVWAVGRFVDTQGYNQVLTEHWNGTSWSIIPSPQPGTYANYLLAVTALSSNDVWAVGLYQNYKGMYQEPEKTLIEHWDGTRWSVIPSPNTAKFYNSLSGVAALSPTDIWAVGSSDQPLVEHWNGKRWSIVPSPKPGAFGGGLASVTALSSTDVWAVGSYAATKFGQQTLVEHWNGTQWLVVNSPPLGQFANELRSVSAVSANDIWASGDYTSRTLTEHWNGKTWSVVPSPSPTGNDGLFGIDALSTNDVWAVGAYSGTSQNLVEQWNGTSWNVVPSHFRYGAISTLLAVSHDSASDLWAVGVDINTHTFAYQTLIEHDCPL